MDTTEKYIKMCEKAEEIQNLIDMFQLGNFLWRGKEYLYEACVCDAVPCFKDEKVWLPRQDELQDILKATHLTNPYNLVSFLWNVLNEDKSCPEEVSCEECIKESMYWRNFKTMEQLWLAFVMYEKYNKSWNGKKWVEENEVKVPFIGGIRVRHGDIK